MLFRFTIRVLKNFYYNSKTNYFYVISQEIYVNL